MDFAPALERAALVYAMRCEESEVEAAYDVVLEALLTVPRPADINAPWTPDPEWCRRIIALATAFNTKYGSNG